jgi:hypothetical protein
MADTQAPTLEKLAIAPKPAPPTDGAAAPPSDNVRVAGAFRFGWALEELVWRLRNWSVPKEAESDDDDFPPDLTHQRSSAAHVRELVSLLEANGALIVGQDGKAPPSVAAVITRVKEMLAKSDADGESDRTGTARIGLSIPGLDVDIVDSIIDQSPEVLTAYELGKALSLTQWRTRDAWANGGPAGTPGDPGLVAAWGNELAKDRITKLRRHLETLAPAIDPRTVSAVSASLSFWSRAYENGQIAAPGKNLGKDEKPAQQLPNAPADQKRLQDKLDAQLRIWYDLLSGRRQLDGFPVTAVISDLVRNYATAQLAPWKRYLLVVVGIVVLVVLVAGVVYVLLSAFAQSGSVGSAGSGLAGGLTALTAYLAARGSGLLDRGTAAVQDLQTRVAQLQSQVASMMPSASTEPPPMTFRGLAGDVVANVVEQIRLEESKIAISQPLVDYIMSDNPSDPPQKVIRDFLTYVIGVDQQTNLDRLQGVLLGLSKDYSPELPAVLQ